MTGVSQSSRAMIRPKILEDFDQAEGVFLVGGELAFRRHLRRELLPPPLGHELPALGRLLVPHGAGGPGLHPAEAALGGASPSNPYRPVRIAMCKVGPEVDLTAVPFPLPSERAFRYGAQPLAR